MSGLIRRRILVNYRVDPQVLQRILPQPFTPKLSHGYGIAGICLIRLEQIHPRLVPLEMGLSSENAAHRIAVTWQENGETHEGVYIPRRDTSSLLNVTAGGRIFQGMHHFSQFEARQLDTSLTLKMHNPQDGTHLELDAAFTDVFQTDSVFDSITEASAFFEGGAVGFSVTNEPAKLDAIELRTFDWQLRPLHVNHLQSSFFENPDLFPKDSIAFDCALLMTDLAHEWHAHPPFTVQASQN